MRPILMSLLLAGAALSAPAMAAAKKETAPDPRIGVLEQQLRDVQLQLKELKASQADLDSSAALGDLKRSTSAQYADVNDHFAALPKTTLSNGRVAFA